MYTLTRMIPSTLAVLAVLIVLPLRALAEPDIDATPVVDINQAGEEELAEALDGVGTVTAQAIVTEREENGRFHSPDELARVQGIGQVTIDNNRERIRME